MNHLISILKNKYKIEYNALFELTADIRSEICAELDIGSRQLCNMLKSDNIYFEYILKQESSGDRKRKYYIKLLCEGGASLTRTTMTTQDFEIINYFDLKLMMFKPDQLINGTQFCDAFKKSFKDWLRSDRAKENIKILTKHVNDERQQQGLSPIEIIRKIENAPNGFRGIYINLDLSIILAQDISVEYKIQMIKFVKDHHLREHRLKYEKIITNKDDVINKLNKNINDIKRINQEQSLEIKELLKQSKRVLEDNQETHKKLDDIKQDNTYLVEEVEDLNEQVNIMHDKINDIKDNYVPTDEFTTFCVFKMKTEFYTLRCKTSDVEKNKLPLSDYTLFFSIVTPSSVEFYLTFKEYYGTGLSYYNKQLLNKPSRLQRYKIAYKYNKFILCKGVSESDLKQLLEYHYDRPNQKINTPR